MIKLRREGLYVKYLSDRFSEIKLLEQSLTFFMEGANYSKLYQTNRWDGFIKFYDRREKQFKYGFLNFVCNKLDENNISYKIENKFEEIIIDEKNLNPKLFQHQKEAVISFCKDPYGYIKIPTRGGKTFLSGELIRVSNLKKVLFVVDSQVLFRQVVDELSKYLKINKKDIGKIAEGKFFIKDINVASIQTLQSIMFGPERLKNKKRKGGENFDINKYKNKIKELKLRSDSLKDFLKKVDFMIVDECHEYSSEERIEVLMNMSNIKAGLFLSATPRKNNGGEIVNVRLESITGHKVYEIEPNTLKKRGILSHETILLVMINHNKNRNILLRENDGYLDFEREVIVNNEQRNNIIVNIIQILQSMNLKTLTLFQKIDHGLYVQRITGYEYLTGSTKLVTRVDVLKRFNKRKFGVLLASNIFNKGLTLSSTEILLNAGGGLEQSSIIQKKGRVLGVTETKKKALIIDFIDNYEYFNKHSLSRIMVYEETVGIENIDVLDSLDKNFYQDLREYLSNWKTD